jgi:outer membrane immunogenic protein
MKRSLLSYVALFAFASGSALAADLPPPSVYKSPPPPPAASWTGCYINGGGGGGLMTTNQHTETFPGLVSTSGAVDTGGQGWFGVGGGGCDYQFHVMNWDLVFGAFGDYDFMNLRGTASFPGGITGDEKESSAWAGGLRLGALVAPSVLVYTTGGYTGAHLNAVSLATPAGVPTGTGLSSQNLNGWFLGGGTETSLGWVMPGLFLRTEYRYSSYQATDNPIITTATGAPTGAGVHANMYTQTVFTELVWRFNFTGARW